MSKPIFTKSGNAYSPFTFEKCRFLPANEPITANQIIGISGGNQVKVADLGGNEKIYNIVINRVSETNRNNLLGFIQDSTVNYKENTFTFTDENGTDYEVRYWGDVTDFPKVRGGLYNLVLPVRVEV